MGCPLWRCALIDAWMAGHFFLRASVVDGVPVEQEGKRSRTRERRTSGMGKGMTKD